MPPNDSSRDRENAPKQAEWRRLLRLPTRRRPQIDADVDDELSFHLAMREEELRSRGLSSDEAASEARRRFGDVAEAREALRRSERHTEWLSRARAAWGAVRHDLGYATRRIVREPSFSLVVVLTLALGIGSTVAIASIVRRMLIAPLPYSGADRLVLIDQTTADGSIHITANADLVEGLGGGATPSLERIERLSSDRLPSVRDGFPVMIPTGLVSPGLLAYLHATPALGRAFINDDARPGAAPVTMLSWTTWQRHYAGSASVIGTTLAMGEQSYTIIGVMPRLFDPSVFGLMPKSEVWLPHSLSEKERYFSAIGVMRHTAKFDVMMRELKAAYARIPEAKRFKTLTVSAKPLMESAGANGRSTLMIMLAAVAIVLLIACMNVANLLLARGVSRERELAVRGAIGASRGRLVRQLLAESAILATIGGSLGILLAREFLKLVAAWRPSSYAAIEDVRIDGTMLLFTLALSLGTAVLFGLGPALLNSRGNGALLQRGLRSVGSGRVGQRTRRVLAFAEVACAVTLVIAATLLARSGNAIQHLRLGYDVSPLATLSVQSADVGIGSSTRSRMPNAAPPIGIATLLAPAIERLRAMPNVNGVTIGSGLPGEFGGCSCEFLVEGVPMPPDPLMRFIYMWSADSAYLHTVGTRLLDGRGLSPDTLAREVLISQGAAAKYWPGARAVGRRFRLQRDSKWYTVVGVIENQRAQNGRMLDDSVQVVMQASPSGPETNIIARVSNSPGEALRTISRVIEESAPTLRVTDALPMQALVDEARAPQRFARVLLGAFAFCALMLAVIGLYGVMSYGVAQRTREIGVRMALGAQRTSILRLILGEGVVIMLAGAAGGCIASLMLNRLLTELLQGVSATDALAYVGAIAIVVFTSLVALWLPTRRALQVDPVEAVSTE